MQYATSGSAAARRPPFVDLVSPQLSVFPSNWATRTAENLPTLLQEFVAIAYHIGKGTTYRRSEPVLPWMYGDCSVRAGGCFILCGAYASRENCSGMSYLSFLRQQA